MLFLINSSLLNNNGFVRDCALPNILMDGSAMFPRSFHPVRDIFLPDSQKIAWYKSRTAVTVRYYFVDFGLSSHLPPDKAQQVVGVYGRDQDVPELSDDVPYDPFKTDIFIIGNMLRNEFTEVSDGLNAMAHA